MLHLDHVYQKSMTHSKTMQIILILLCQMYNLLEYSDNYSMTLGSLWNYYRDELIDSAIENNSGNNNSGNNINNSKK